MKKTLQECKEIVAKKRGFKDWIELKIVSPKTEHYTDLANKMYYEQSEWISVDDALPEISKSVLVLIHGVEAIGFRVNKTFWMVEDRNVVASLITHWQSLPNPPQK